MKASQFSDAQKTFILKQGREGVSVAEICRCHSSSAEVRTKIGWSPALAAQQTRHGLAGPTDGQEHSHES